MRDILRAEAAVIGAKFVDPLAERWLWDDPSLIGADWIHPNRAGQGIWRRRSCRSSRLNYRRRRPEPAG